METIAPSRASTASACSTGPAGHVLHRLRRIGTPRWTRTPSTCALCHAPGAPRVERRPASRVRIFRGPRRPAAAWRWSPRSTTSRRAARPPATRTRPEMKVLGVLDVALDLDSVDQEVASMKLRVLLVTAVEIALISLFIIFFTRRFLARPIAKLIDGFKAVSQMELDKPLEHRRRQRGTRRAGALLQRDARPAAGRARRNQPVHPEPGNEGGGAHEQLKSGAEEAAAERPAGLARPARGQRRARDQQPGLRRAQSLDAAAAHVEGRRDSAGPHGGFPQVPGAGDQRDGARGADRLRPAGLLPPRQAAARPGRPEQDRRDDALAGAAQDEAEQRDRGDAIWRTDLPHGRRAIARRSSRWC